MVGPRRIKPKTKPEQTLSVPFVFCNRLNFSEYVKTLETIREHRGLTASAVLVAPLPVAA
jgi:hypothetical protein